MIRLSLPYPPSVNRMYRVPKNLGRAILSADGRDYKQAVAAIAMQKRLQPRDGPIAVEYVLHPRRNKDGSASQVRIDLGNCEKVASDALNGLAWHDDKQICRMLLTVGEAVDGGGLTVRIDSWAG